MRPNRSEYKWGRKMGNWGQGIEHNEFCGSLQALAAKKSGGGFTIKNRERNRGFFRGYVDAATTLVAIDARTRVLNSANWKPRGSRHEDV